MKKFFLTIVLAMFLSFPAHAKESVVQVKGMVCDFCAQALNKVFLKEESVESLDINLDDQTVTILYKDGVEPLSQDVIEKNIYWAGYDFVEIKEN